MRVSYGAANRDMRVGTTFSSRGHGRAGMALAGLVALTAACASGGGAPPLTGAEAEAVFAGLSGVWKLDESSSANVPGFQIRNGPTEVIHVDDMEQARQIVARMAEEEMQRVEFVLMYDRDEGGNRERGHGC